MPIINNLDLGAHPTWRASMATRKGAIWGADTQNLAVTGGQSIIYSKSGTIRKRTETIWISVVPADPVRVLYLVRQLQELSNNPNLQPVYIQWASGAGTIVADPEDGWYTLENVTPDEDIAVDGIVPVQVTVSYLAPGLASRALAVSYIGGPANIGWGGGVQNWLAYPLNASGMPFLINRFGAEGYIPVSYQLPMSSLTPQVFSPSQVVANLFQDRVAVYDTLNTASNPVPTGGASVNSAWVEVLHPDHQFVGDCVITNDLILLLCQVGQRGITIYFWNINTSQWLQFGRLDGFDNNNSGSIFQVLQGIALGRISFRECSIALYFATSASNWIKVILRMPAGANYVRCQLVELTQTNTILQPLQLTATAANPKATYNDTFLLDNSLTAENVALPRADQVISTSNSFGYCCGFANSASLPCIFGWLYLDATTQVDQGFAAPTGIGLGDSQVHPVINESKFFGFFVAPFPSTQNLQAEAESGTLSGGFTSVVDAAASNGHAAEAPSGTGSNAQAKFGTAWVPPAGLYDVWFRIRVTSAASSTPQMTLGLLDVNTSGFVSGSASTLAPNSFATTYTWKKVNSTTPVFVPPGHQLQFLANTSTTLNTNWFIDEAMLVPIQMIPSMNSLIGPREIFGNFAFDRVLKVVPIT